LHRFSIDSDVFFDRVMCSVSVKLNIFSPAYTQWQQLQKHIHVNIDNNKRNTL